VSTNEQSAVGSPIMAKLSGLKHPKLHAVSSVCAYYIHLMSKTCSWQLTKVWASTFIYSVLTHAVTFESIRMESNPPPPSPPGCLTKKLWSQSDSLSMERPPTDSADRTARMGIRFLGNQLGIFRKMIPP